MLLESFIYFMVLIIIFYLIMIEDIFIEGDLIGDEKVNKIELNLIDDIIKIIDEYNDYIDEGLIRGDLYFNKNKGLYILFDVILIIGGSGIIDEYLLSLKKINDINLIKELIGKD